jgi:hypothetical protein
VLLAGVPVYPGRGKGDDSDVAAESVSGPIYQNNPWSCSSNSKIAFAAVPGHALRDILIQECKEGVENLCWDASCRKKRRLMHYVFEQPTVRIICQDVRHVMLLAERSSLFKHLSSVSRVRFSAIGSLELRVCYVDLGQCTQVIWGRTSTRCIARR